MTASEQTSLLSGQRPRSASQANNDGNTKRKGLYSPEISQSLFLTLFACIWLTWFIGSFDSTIMASSHPVISTYFGASNHATWFSTSFLITSSACSPIFARASDAFGRRVPLLLSLGAFAFGTLCCAVAPTALSFILARAFCGLGAGASLSQTVTLISDLVPLRRRGTYISFVNLAYGTGSSLGAATGGILAETIGWRWEFGIQVPGIILVIIVVYLSVPSNLGPELARQNSESLLQTLKSFDISGSLLLTLTVGCLVAFLTIGGNSLPWSHPLIIAALLTFVVFGATLMRVEYREPRAVLPPCLVFQSPQANIVWSNFFSCMSMSTVLFCSPLFFQSVLLDSASRSGMRLFIPFLVGMVAAFSTGNLVTCTGLLLPWILLGYVLLLLGLGLMTIMPATLPDSAYAIIISLPLVGQGFAFPTLIVAQLAVTPEDDVAIATATLLLLKNLGNVVGVAVSGLVSQNALYYYLEQFVEPGPEKLRVIEQVRKAVETVRHLREPFLSQVVAAHSRAMQLTFFQAAATTGLALCLILIIRIPTLRNKPGQRSDDV